MIFALVGNQNCGKTTLFNQLTGSNRHVGNFPGVTVDGKAGDIRDRKDAAVVDLPGIYSIRPYTNEETVTRDYILNQHPDGIINIADATNIERNLYLTLQLIELGIPMVLALNMMDEVRGNGGTVDIAGMSDLLGIPVVPISASKNEGIDELIRVAVQTVRCGVNPKKVDFCKDGATHRCIHAVSHLIEDHARAAKIAPRFAATKVIEEDFDILERLNLDQNEIEMIEHTVIETEREEGLDRHEALASMRYDFIESVTAKTVVKCRESRERLRSEKIDRVLTHRVFAIPIFIGVMLFVFALTFAWVGNFFANLLDLGISALGAAVARGLDSLSLDGATVNPAVKSLITDGIFGGVGSVVSFVPYIVVLFFCLSILEDTGYMARIAFVMDKPLRKIGLSGRSFVPMLIGFGCTVPAVMSSRTLSSERDRIMTILLTPFMSCSAKMTIYLFFVNALFDNPWTKVAVMAALYFGGAAVGILITMIFNKTAFRGNPVPFVMELPNYRFPSMKSVLILLWEKARDFLQKAFTVILLATVCIWFFSNFDLGLNYTPDRSELSVLGRLGSLIAVIFRPLGFDRYEAVMALISGFTAKEAVVSTLEMLAPGGIFSLFGSTAAAVSFLVFTLLYTPCLAAIAAIRGELGSTRRALSVVLFQCAVAWIFSFLVYRSLLLLSKTTWLDRLILFLVLIWIVAAFVFLGKRRKKGKPVCTCGGDCSACGACRNDGTCDRKCDATDADTEAASSVK